jgi:hypothetical protein
MATIGVGKGSYIRPHRRVRTRTFLEDSSQSFIVGDPVCLSADSDDGDYIKIAAADPATDRNFVGFAASAATGTKGGKVVVWLATGDAEFLVHVEDGMTLDRDFVDTEYGIVADATNLIWRLDTTETTAKIFRVLEMYDAHGDLNGRVVAHVIAPERLYHD